MPGIVNGRLGLPGSARIKRPGVGVRLQDYHLDRLAHSARHFGFEFQRELALENITAFESAQPQRMRLLLGPSGEPEIQATACPKVDSVVQLKLAVAPLDCMSPFLFHQTTHRLVYDIARLGQDDCDDVLLWKERDEITETTIYNIYLEIDGRLFTPPLNSGLLAGVYRRMMLETGKASELPLFKTDLDRASRIFVSNSVRGLIPAKLILP